MNSTSTTLDALHTILQEAAAQPSAPAGSDTQKLATFYSACMNETAIESAGTEPLDPLLAEITAIGDQRAVVHEVARLQALGVNDGPTFGAIADAKDSTATIAVLRTGGLGMPDASYYLRDDEHAKSIRIGYRAYVATQLQNLGEQATVAAAEADDIVALETALAKVTPNRAELFDPTKTYHPTTVAGLHTLAPQVPWDAFFAPFSAPPFERINVISPGLVASFGDQVGRSSIATWRAYLRFHLIDAYASALPKRFADPSFTFHSGVMQGVNQELPRWQRCVEATDRALRTPLGQAYVARYFAPAAKARAVAMVDNLQNTLRADIESLELDERLDQTLRGRETQCVHQEDRVSRSLARLLDPDDSRACVVRKPAANRAGMEYLG